MKKYQIIYADPPWDYGKPLKWAGMHGKAYGPEHYYPTFKDLSKVELFARQKTEGWDVWGNEVESDINL